MKTTLRELLLLTLVVALALGWWLDHSQQYSRAERYKKVLEIAGLGESIPINKCFFGNLESVVSAAIDSGLVEIGLGADDGLKPGQVLNVVRGDKYLGKIIITTTGPDRAIAKIDPKSQRGEIQKGDRTMKTLR